MTAVIRRARRLARIAVPAAIAIVGAGHVGSPNVIYDGKAGSYDLRVIVRPPEVVPGLAEVTVRILGGDARRVLVRPVFWRAGVAGSPSPDEATRVPGERQMYTARLWLMARGAYSVYVTVEGASGTGTASVPVMSVATRRLGMTLGLGVVLGVLALLLLAALVTIVYDAAGEGVTPAGLPVDAARRRRARLVAALSVPVLCLAVLGGAKWWGSVDADYAQRLYRSPRTHAAVGGDAGRPVLRFTVLDSAGEPAPLDPLMPDHGRMMHLFAIDTTMRSFAHLHPAFDGAATFEAALPPLPSGRYRLYGDIVTEIGQSRTLTGSVDVTRADSVASSRAAHADVDDGWLVSSEEVPRLAVGAVAPLPDGARIQWSGGDVSAWRAGQEVVLRFLVRDQGGAPAALEPYLGMPAHAVVANRDGSTFIHLHPMGTISLAAQQVFALRDRGDTTSHGRLRLESDAMSAVHEMEPAPELSFPYEFPKAGDYRVWLQLRRAGRVFTGAFDVRVAGDTGR